MTTEEEKRILSGLFQGRPTETREFYVKYGPYIHGVARKISRRDAALDIDDLVQDALLHLFEHDYRRLKTFLFRAKLSTFICTLARRHLIEKASAHKLKSEQTSGWESGKFDAAPEWDWSVIDEMASGEKLDQKLDRAKEIKILGQILESLDVHNKLLWILMCLQRDPTDYIKLLGYRDRDQVHSAKHEFIKRLRKDFLGRRWHKNER